MFLIVNTKECKDNAFRYSECYVLTQTLPTWSHTLNKFWHLSYPHPTIFGHHANSSQLCIDTVHYIIWLYLASNTTNADMLLHTHKNAMQQIQQSNRSSRTLSRGNPKYQIAKHSFAFSFRLLQLSLLLAVGSRCYFVVSSLLLLSTTNFDVFLLLGMVKNNIFEFGLRFLHSGKKSPNTMRHKCE